MAQLLFSVPNAPDFDPRVWETAYITGIEGIPWLCQQSLKGDQFSIGRQIDESGKLHIVWPTASLGNICLSSTSLRVVPETYSLPLEIARGTVHRLKSQASEWQRVGMRLPDRFFPMAEQALNALLHALTCRDKQDQIPLAQRAIDLSLQANVVLTEAFSLQALEARRSNEGRLATLLGCRLDPTTDLHRIGEALNTAFNLICVAADWGAVESDTGKQEFDSYDQQVEWASKTNQKVCIGPLVDFRNGKLPPWMALLDESFDSVLTAACAHVQRTVERYRGKAHLWNCAAGLNVPNQFKWNDEQVLRMAVSLIETVRRGDDRSPVLLTIDQPWSEYLRDDANGISPLHFADALIRADLGLSGLALELNFDHWPGGTFPRDPIEINRLIDRWSMLGLPLMVILRAPTSLAKTGQRVSNWQMPDVTAVEQPVENQDAEPQEGGEIEFNGLLAPETIIRMLLSKPSIHAIIWNGLSDQQAQGFQDCGLWDAEGKPKTLLGSIAKLRKTCLH